MGEDLGVCKGKDRACRLCRSDVEKVEWVSAFSLPWRGNPTRWLALNGVRLVLRGNRAETGKPGTVPWVVQNEGEQVATVSSEACQTETWEDWNAYQQRLFALPVTRKRVRLSSSKPLLIFVKSQSTRSTLALLMELALSRLALQHDRIAHPSALM